MSVVVLPSQAFQEQVSGAFKRFEHAVSCEDARQFHSTELKDVWTAAKTIEIRLGKEQKLRNLSRLRPFLEGVERYSKVVEILCNGTPYLPWIWAPIKLFLQISNEYTDAFESLIQAYGQIAECLPRFDRLSNAFKDTPDFQNVLAVLYTDILDFHRRAYKFFRAKAWKRFFNSSWGRFNHRFNNVLDSLRRHADLVDREANSHNIVAVQEWRQTALEEIARREKDRGIAQFASVLSWLDTRDYQQEDILGGLVDRCHPGTSDWLFSHAKVESWMSDSSELPVLWLKGIPGSGKSVLSAQLIEKLRSQKKGSVAYYLCSFRNDGQENCSMILKAIAAQMMRQNKHLSAYVCDEYISHGRTPSIKELKQLIPDLISGSLSSRIVIDGLDECTQDRQKEFLPILLALAKTNNPADTRCKIIVFSRDVPIIARSMKSKHMLTLKEEAVAIEQAIRSYVHSELLELQADLGDLEMPMQMVGDMEETLVSKADGMFLWVRLMFVTFRDLDSIFELRKAVDGLPNGLDEAYGRILQHISKDGGPGNAQKLMRILSWVALAQRPLRTHELLDAIAFSQEPYKLDLGSKLDSRVLDRCKPLIDVDSRGTVSFVHASAKDYVLAMASGPFLPLRQALLEVATGSVAYVCSLFDLIDPSISDQLRTETVVAGFYGLHNYVSVYWLYHLSQLAQVYRGIEEVSDPNLSKIIETLCARHFELTRTSSTSQRSTGDFVKPDPRSAFFEQHQGLHSIAQEVWAHEMLSSEKQMVDLPANISDDDTATTSTLFSVASERYTTIVHRILTPDSERDLPFLSSGSVSRFRELYGIAAYPCCFLFCPRRHDGFATKEDKDNHELLHVPKFLCNEKSCPFATSVGFGTIKQLRRHMRVHHKEINEPLGVPDFGHQPSGSGNMGQQGPQRGLGSPVSHRQNEGRQPHQQEQPQQDALPAQQNTVQQPSPSDLLHAAPSSSWAKDIFGDVSPESSGHDGPDAKFEHEVASMAQFLYKSLGHEKRQDLRAKCETALSDQQLEDGGVDPLVKFLEHISQEALHGRGLQAPQGYVALLDYCIQLFLLERQNKKRLQMAREEQSETSPRSPESGGTLAADQPQNTATNTMTSVGEIDWDEWNKSLPQEERMRSQQDVAINTMTSGDEIDWEAWSQFGRHIERPRLQQLPEVMRMPTIEELDNMPADKRRELWMQRMQQTEALKRATATKQSRTRQYPAAPEQAQPQQVREDSPEKIRLAQLFREVVITTPKGNAIAIPDNATRARCQAVSKGLAPSMSRINQLLLMGMQIFGEARIREIIRMKVIYTQNCLDAEGTIHNRVTLSLPQFQQMAQRLRRFFVELKQAKESNHSLAASASVEHGHHF